MLVPCLAAVNMTLERSAKLRDCQTAPATPTLEARTSRVSCSGYVVLDGFRGEVEVGFMIGWGKTGGIRPPVVFSHAVLPLQEVRYGLRFDSHFHPSQAGQQ